MTIQVTATMPNIAPANLAEFKEVAGRALELTKGESTALQYDWFLSGDETKCVVRETYADSDAILAHMTNLGEVLGKLAELGGGLEVEAFGDPSPELMEAAAALEKGEAEGRRPDDAPRYGDVPPAPSGPRLVHRFPLPDSADPTVNIPKPAPAGSPDGRDRSALRGVRRGRPDR